MTGQDGPAQKVRIARALSQLGYSSRREAERLVSEHHVAVNGVFLDSPVVLVDISTDVIEVDGKRLNRPALLTYAVYKPRGVTSTLRDPRARHTVVELVASPTRLYPVGRLDKESEGLILLTNDGDLAQKVMHPSYCVEKEYEALVDRPPSAAVLRRLRRGVEVDGRLARPLRVAVRDRTSGVRVLLVLAEGRHHEVRRVLGAVGLSVLRLVRTRIGPVHLGRLQPGDWRPLSADEVSALKTRERPPPRGHATHPASSLP